MFEFKKRAVLRDTDAAGIVFFGNYFLLAHDAYEAFMESIGLSLHQILADNRYLLLIAHAEADYKQSLVMGQEYEIRIVVNSIGRTSFSLNYEFLDDAGRTVATLKTVHVATDTVKRAKIEIPGDLRDRLSKAI